jgi:diguanylate cyclase (GGDEF)-like protein
MIVVLTTIANLVILVGASARSRNNRARRLAAVEGMLSSSYVGGAAGASWPGPAADDHDDGADAYIEGPDDADRPLDAGEPAGSLSMVGRDPLTGLLDAISFDDVLAHEDARERRYGRAATVVVFELDGLSKIVDHLGPGIGNRIEVALADTIARQARRADYVARLEPGRYGVLLPETDEIAAINHVERIRAACDAWLESGAIAIRLAIGWASTGGGVQLAAAMRSANDRMLLEMQQNARLAAAEGAAVERDEAAAAAGVDESYGDLSGL